MHVFFIFMTITLSLFGNFVDYVANTSIQNYDINMTINTSGELDITERIEIIPRKLYQSATVDDTLIQLKIDTMIKSSSAIRMIDSEPYEFSLSLNDMPVQWEKRVFYEHSPNKMIRIRFGPKYLNALLTLSEKERLKVLHNQYVYTLKYKVKKTVVESLQGLEKIGWQFIKSPSHIPIKHVNINIFFPSILNKDNIENLNIDCIGKNSTYKWENTQHFSIAIETPNSKGVRFELDFNKGILAQSAKNNFNLVLNKTKSKNTSAYQWDRFLLYWQFPFFILYFMFLYYYARSYGSFATIGSIPVRYKPAANMSLLQSALLLDKSADNSDIPAAIVELASLGYLSIITKQRTDLVYLERLEKDTRSLTEDQKYLLIRILFHGRNIYQLSEDKSALYGKLEMLNKKLHDWMLEDGYLYENFKKTRIRFLIKALLTSLPILFFSLYVTQELYGKQLMIGSIAGLYFVTAIIIFVLIPMRFIHATPFLIAIYIIMGMPFVQSESLSLTLLSNPIIIMPFVYASIWLFYQKIGIFSGRGFRAYRYLLGYKEFIQRTEVQKLEYRLKENPEHTDKSLPYAMLFNLVSYKPLSSYLMTIRKSEILKQHTHRIYGKRIKRKGNFLHIFLFWFMGIILFFILKVSM